MTLIEIFNPQSLSNAYRWLRQRRMHYPPHADVWHLRRHWAQVQHTLLNDLLAGHYRFEPLQRIHKADGTYIHLWSAQDALVLKMVAMGLGTVLNLSPHCTHVKGHGGLKQTVAAVATQLPNYSFVMRTDVKGYYAAIDQHLLLEQLAKYIDNRDILNYAWQVIRRTVTYGGLYRTIKLGISRGCPLSPLFGALYLKALDEALGSRANVGIAYVRYMDDVLILAKSRWRLRRAIKTLNQHFAALKVTQHPDKTFIGRVSRGFDFLGYHFNGGGLTMALATITHHVEQLDRLYELISNSVLLRVRIDQYVRRWLQWCKAGLDGLPLQLNDYCAVSLQRPGRLIRQPSKASS